MSLPPTSSGVPHAPPQGAGGDPSMEDILASIRRILSEDEPEPPQPAVAGGDVMPLDPSMLVDEPPPAHAEPPPALADVPPAASPRPEAARPMPEELPTMIASTPAAAPAPAPPPPAPAARPQSGGLLGPEAAEAASSSVGSLLRTLASERQQVAVRAGGPTIEDLVREEIRPLLKAWLDANLPPLVERLVRAEIERVVGRALS